MIYTIINSEGRSYDLPKKTVTVMEALDKVLTVDDRRGMSLRDKYACLHSFVKDILGEENAKECLGAENIDDMDLSELTLTVRKINDAYERPIEEYTNGKLRDKLGNIPMDKITNMVNAANTMAAQK